jgi:septal ring factor EnvC (AmiA/AmiB activator)
MRERVADMDNSISQMRALLKQMQAKAAKSKATDSLTKTNLQMWELMIGHLNKDLQQLRVTLAAREDLEARRASLYRQADAKAEAEAQAARAAEAARFAQEQNATGTPTPAQAGHGEGQNLAGQPVPTPPTSNSPSPAQTQGSPNSAPPQ